MRRCRYAVLLLLTLAACGAPRDDSVEAVVDVVDGVERLTYPEAGVARLGWRLDTLGVVGGAGALREEEQFNDVAEAGLAGDAAGSLYLLDPQGKRVLVFGPDGRFQATFGREGGGPGELGRPNGLALGPGDTVWLSDPANRRTTLFAPDGAFARSIPFPEGSQAPSGALAVTDGGFTQALLTVSFTPGEVSQPPIPIIRFDTAGVAGDTLWSSPAPLRDQIVLELGQRRMMVLMSPAFQPPLRWAPLPDGGIVVSDTAEYLLRWVSPEGTVRRIVRRLPPARETTERDREWARERLREESEDGRGPALGGLDPELLLRQRLEKMTFAPLVPRITGLRVDGAGRVWVGVSTDTPEETGRIDVYGPEGELLGELHGLDRVPSLFFGGDRAALLTRDELDVQQLVLVRLREGAGARGE